MPEEQVQTVTPTEPVQTATPVETEKTLIEQVGDLLRPEENSQQVVEKEEVQPQEPEIKEGEPQEPTQVEVPKEPNVIDDSFIERYPKLKMYRGKPIESIAVGYEKLVETLNKQSQEIQKLKQKTTTIPKLDEAPDAVENPEAFKKFMKEFEDGVREDERSKLSSQPETPDLRVEIAKYLPKDTDTDAVIDGWVKFNASRIFNEFGERRPEVTEFYNRNPEVLFNEIAGFYNLQSQAQKNELQIKTEGKKLAYENVKGAIRNANQNKENIPNATVNATSRTTVYTPEEELLGKMLTKLSPAG